MNPVLDRKLHGNNKVKDIDNDDLLSAWAFECKPGTRIRERENKKQILKKMFGVTSLPLTHLR